jgi:hypothetical protein
MRKWMGWVAVLALAACDTEADLGKVPKPGKERLGNRPCTEPWGLDFDDAYPVVRSGVVQPGDIDGDGDLDLVMAMDDGYLLPMLNDGNGELEPGDKVPLGASPSALALADMNGDGVLDAVLANILNDFENKGEILLATGGGDGTFQVWLTIPTRKAPFDVALSDFNGDAILDIFTSQSLTRSGSGETFDPFELFLGQMTPGVFQPAPPLGLLAEWGGSAFPSDLNGDGTLDLLVTLSDPNRGGSFILRGLGNGTFEAPTPLQSQGVFPQELLDWDADGDVDVVVTDTAGSGIPSKYALLPNAGDGTFEPARPFAAQLGQRAISFHDINGDGAFDALSGQTGRLEIHFGTPQGDLDPTPAHVRLIGNPMVMGFGHLNGDDRIDMVLLADETLNIVLARCH